MITRFIDDFDEASIKYGKQRDYSVELCRSKLHIDLDEGQIQMLHYLWECAFDEGVEQQNLEMQS